MCFISTVSSIPDGEIQRAVHTVEAEHDQATGRLELIRLDFNDNGTNDTWSYMDGRIVQRIEIDRAEDGAVERWVRSNTAFTIPGSIPTLT